MKVVGVDRLPKSFLRISHGSKSNTVSTCGLRNAKAQSVLELAVVKDVTGEDKCLACGCWRKRPECRDGMLHCDKWSGTINGYCSVELRDRFWGKGGERIRRVVELILDGCGKSE